MSLSSAQDRCRRCPQPSRPSRAFSRSTASVPRWPRANSPPPHDLDVSSTVPRGQLNVTAEQLQLDAARAPSAARASRRSAASSAAACASAAVARHCGNWRPRPTAPSRRSCRTARCRTRSCSRRASNSAAYSGGCATSRKETDIRCAVAKLDVQEGIGTVRTLVIDTDDALLTRRRHGESRVRFARSLPARQAEEAEPRSALLGAPAGEPGSPAPEREWPRRRRTDGRSGGPRRTLDAGRERARLCESGTGP